MKILAGCGLVCVQVWLGVGGCGYVCLCKKFGWVCITWLGVHNIKFGWVWLGVARCGRVWLGVAGCGRVWLGVAGCGWVHCLVKPTNNP